MTSNDHFIYVCPDDPEYEIMRALRQRLQSPQSTANAIHRSGDESEDGRTRQSTTNNEPFYEEVEDVGGEQPYDRSPESIPLRCDTI